MTLTSPNRGYPLERLEGSTGSMSYWNGLFSRIAGYLDELRSAAQTASEIDGVGSSVTAARTDARDLVSALAPDIAEAELLAAVLARYADAFSTSADAANRLIEDIESAHATWESAANEAETAGLRALWSSRTDDAEQSAEDNEAAGEAVDARDSAKDALDELWLQFEGHYGAWDTAYDSALAELAAGSGTVLTANARDLLDDLLAANDPAAVRAFWDAHPELHDELIAAHPDIIGNLDGIPYSDRDEANYAHLVEVYNSDLEEPLRSEIDALWTEVTRNGATLIAFDPDGSAQLTAAVAYGSVEDATDVSMLVSGMNSGVGDVTTWGGSARALNAAVDAVSGEGSSATIVWFGYDTPTVPEEPFMDRAEDGAAAMRSFLQGLQVEAPSADVAVIAHSYGSTTAALAIGSDPGGLGVDQFIIVGSAGLPSDPQVLENLSTGPQVYATLSDGDMWARIGRDSSWGGEHSTVPETLPGTIEFGSDGGYQLNDDGSYATEGEHGGSPLLGTPGHGSHAGGNALPWEGDDLDDGYLSPGTESFYNIEQIVLTGQPGTTMDGVGSGGGMWDTPDWLPFSPYHF